MNILLDYFFPITAISPTPAASTAFLKQVCVIAKPKTGQEDNVGNIYECDNATEVAARTDNTDSNNLFTAGMNKVYILLSNDLDIADAIAANGNLFYTVLVSSDYDDDDIASIDLGIFTGVFGISSDDDTVMATQAAIENRCAFYAKTGNIAENMFFSFGKLLSNSLNWLNQQYITAASTDDVVTLGSANSFFDDKISFVITDSEFGNRLGLFACGGKAIVAPYITRNLEIDIQSKALQYISGNMPGYTNTQAALLEDELQKVIASYIERALIELGVIEVKLEQDNFVASGYINISEPRALWRVFGQIKQTL